MSCDKRPWFKWFPKEYMLKPEVMALNDTAELLYRRILDELAMAPSMSIDSDKTSVFALVGRGIERDVFDDAFDSLFTEGFEALTLRNGKIYSEEIFALSSPKLIFSDGCVSGEKWMVIREQVFKEDGYECQYCGAKSFPLECDHIIPKSRGGTYMYENLITACINCNRSKSSKTLSEWLS